MSIMSVDRSALEAVDGPGAVYYEYDPTCPDATPKLMRKRKAEDEGVPFSASKK